MHVPHHLPPPPEPNRAQPWKTPSEKDDNGPFSRVSERAEDSRRQGARRPPPRRQQPEQEAPRQNRLRAQPLGALREPFMAVTPVTQFWTELVMAAKPVDPLVAAPAAKKPSEPTLLELFAKTVK
jgi:hypothetical protein